MLGGSWKGILKLMLTGIYQDKTENAVIVKSFCMCIDGGLRKGVLIVGISICCFSM